MKRRKAATKSDEGRSNDPKTPRAKKTRSTAKKPVGKHEPAGKQKPVGKLPPVGKHRPVAPPTRTGDQIMSVNIEDRIKSIETALRQFGLTWMDGPVQGNGAPAQAVAAGFPSFQSYVARNRRTSVVADGAPAAAVAPYTIEVRFGDGLSQTQRDAFQATADRWTRAITAALPAVVVDGETVTGVIIIAQGSDIDGSGGILGQAGPTRLRPRNAGSAALLPAKGEMTFDTADLADMESRGTLNDVIAHEMGHVIGIGTLWSDKGFLSGEGTSNPTFTGTNASREYGTLRGTTATAVPVENRGGQGTADSHWRDSVFGNELMTGFVGDAGNPLSRLTIASLEDLGYTVDYSAAETYRLPNHLLMAEGSFAGLVNELARGTMLPHLPIVLPNDSLR